VEAALEGRWVDAVRRRISWAKFWSPARPKIENGTRQMQLARNFFLKILWGEGCVLGALDLDVWTAKIGFGGVIRG
jgi:hypothetical protein